MAQAFGYDIVMGFAEESTFGTYVSPTNYLELQSESMALTQNAIAKPVLNSAAVTNYVLSKKAVAGSLEFCFPYAGAEILLKHACGGAVASAQIGASGTYTHTFALADDMLTGLSITMDRDGDNISTSYAYTGCQVSVLTLTQETENFLMCNVELVGKDESKQSNPTASYPTFIGAEWTQVTTATFNGTGVDAMVSEFKIENPLADDRYKLGDRTRKGLGRNGARKVTGKINLEFDDVTEYDLFRDSTETAVVMEWTGPAAAGGEFYKLTITCPKVVFSGTTPVASELGPLSMEMPFEAFVGSGPADEIQIVLQNVTSSIP